jgi:hypothetical protein
MHFPFFHPGLTGNSIGPPWQNAAAFVLTAVHHVPILRHLVIREDFENRTHPELLLLVLDFMNGNQQLLLLLFLPCLTFFSEPLQQQRIGSSTSE